MRILITGGGTIVKIDDIRHIGNFSTGSFAVKIAEAALSKGHGVIYFHAKNAKVPPPAGKLEKIAFETYEDYARGLKQILRGHRIDAAFLGTAVSDYGIKPYRGKISSSKRSVTLRLIRLPKIIKSVKKWSKNHIFQIGFKLLSNVPKQELIETAYKSGVKNGSDLTIANDFKKIRSGGREVILITPEKGAIRMKEPGLAEKIIDFVEKRSKTTHFRTITARNKSVARKYKNEIAFFQTLSRRLSRRGLMTKFYTGSDSEHGSLALRVDGDSFLITSRASNKSNLQTENIILVKKVDWKKKEITVESIGGRKASFNAALVSSLLNRFPRINAVVHTHSFIKHAPITKFPYTPGTIEYATEPLKLFKKKIRAINLKEHGLVAIGENLDETVKYVLRHASR